MRFRAAPGTTLNSPAAATVSMKPPKSGTIGPMSTTTRRNPPGAVELQSVRLHGHRVCYRMAGEGPAIVLIHGVTSSSENWDRVISLLAQEFTVVAPDLI